MGEKLIHDGGGPAFPTMVGPNQSFMQGMPLRDYFAAHAPHAPITDFFTDEAADVVAVASYRYADAMLRARAK